MVATGGKKVAGRKRHVLVDTLGLIWGLLVLPADVQDRYVAKPLLASARGRLPRLKVAWADGGYAGQLIDWVTVACGWVLQTVLRPTTAKGFVVLPRRWVVERTFAWLGRYRRLSKDYEHNPASSAAWNYLAMTHRMARQLLPARDPGNRLRRMRRRPKRR